MGDLRRSPGLLGMFLWISGVVWAAEELFGSSVDIGNYLRCILGSSGAL